MSGYIGDYAPSTVIYGKFTTYQPSTGAAFALAGTPALSVYKDNSTTQSTSGVTLTASFDSVTGLNHFAIDTSSDGTFYSAGSNFDIVITAGTVDSVSVVGSVVGSFSLNKVAALRPTTAGRSLDVSSGGEAGVDWANVGSPTTSLNLSGTTISTSQAVASVTGAVGSVTGNVTGSVGSVTARVTANTDQLAGQTVTAAAGVTFPTSVASPTNITAGTITTVTNLTNAPTAGDFTATMKTSIGTAVAASAVASVTGNVGGNVTGSVGSVVGLTASNLDTTVSSRMATYTQPTGFLSASFPSAVGDATIANQSTINSNVLSRAAPGDEMDLVDAPNATAVAAIQSGLSTFNAASDEVLANIKKVNGVTVVGDGQSGNEWGPA